MAFPNWDSDCLGRICSRYDNQGVCQEYINNTLNVPFLKGFECIFRNVIFVIAEIALLVAFIMLVVGAFKYITAGGDAKAVDSAKGTLTYAIFGLIGLILVWLFLKLLSVITGFDLTIFKVGV